MTSNGKNTGRWTSEEHEAFVEGLRRYGNRWKDVKKLVPTRSIVQIRTHAQKYFIKKAKEQGISPSKVTIGEQVASEFGSDPSTPPQRREGSIAQSSNKRPRAPQQPYSPYMESAKKEPKMLGDSKFNLDDGGSYNPREPSLHDLPGLPVIRDTKDIGEAPSIPDITLRHVYLEPVSRQDSIGISLRSAGDYSAYVRVDALPRVQMSASSSGQDSQVVGQGGGASQGNERGTQAIQYVPGVAERSGAVNKGDFLVGICGITTADLPPKSVGAMIGAVRNATTKGAIVIHLSEREISDVAFPLAAQHMRDAATALLGPKWYEHVSRVAKKARAEAMKETTMASHSWQAIATARDPDANGKAS